MSRHPDCTYWEVFNKLMPLPTEPEPLHRERFSQRKVYFLHAPELRRVKIGYSADPQKRCERVRSEFHLPREITLTVIGTLDGGPLIERLMHGRFAAHRVSGEWFEDSILPDVERLIEDELAWFGDAA